MGEWSNAKINPPKKSGFYLIAKSNNKGNTTVFGYATAVFLKKGEEYISRSVPIDVSKNDNKLLFAICKYDTIITAPATGFYEVKRINNGEELEFLDQNLVIWQDIDDIPGFTNEFEEKKKRIEKYHLSTDIERTDILNQIKAYTKENKKLEKVMRNLCEIFEDDEYEVCGVSYNVNPLEIEKAFLRALIIRDEIKGLSSYADIDKIIDITFNQKQVNINEALKMRDNLCKFMDNLEYHPDDINLLSDAYFTSIFLPTKKDIIKVLSKDERKKNPGEDRNAFYTRLFQRYMINAEVRNIAGNFRGKDHPHDDLLDILNLQNLSTAIAISNLEIHEYLPNFVDEMGINDNDKEK